MSSFLSSSCTVVNNRYFRLMVLSLRKGAGHMLAFQQQGEYESFLVGERGSETNISIYTGYLG
jgi:hypothetical protein